MKIKTKGTCPKCHEAFASAQAKTHLLACALRHNTQSPSFKEGYLIQISSAGNPSIYWIFATMPIDASFGLLDSFLRATWVECCGHLSQFTVNGQYFFSRDESGDLDPAMKNKIGDLLAPGSKCEYVYDMGSSTHLEIKILEKIDFCQQKKITILMQNNPPDLPCESCKSKASIICSQCGSTTCSKCSKEHDCVLEEDDDYMLMRLVNSPRTGVCGYEGS